MARKQASTRRVTTASILLAASFARGVEDRRAGRPPQFDDEAFDWGYERGRQWASLAPADMPLRTGGELNPMAISLLEAAFNRKLIT